MSRPLHKAPWMVLEVQIASIARRLAATNVPILERKAPLLNMEHVDKSSFSMHNNVGTFSAGLADAMVPRAAFESYVRGGR